MSLISLSKLAIVVKPTDSVSKVISKMIKDDVYEVVVMEKDTFHGVVVARDIAKRKINDPKKAEIKQYVKRVNVLQPDQSVDDVIETMVVNDQKAVPIVKNNKYYLLTRMSLLKSLMDHKSLRNKTANNVMTFPFFAKNYDPITTVMSVLGELNVSRLPIVGENNKLEGMVTTKDLLRAQVDRQRLGLGAKGGEKSKIRKTPISSLMKKNVVTLAPMTPIKTIIETMLRKNTDTVIIEEYNKIVGIITPKHILKMIRREPTEPEKEVSGVYLKISGIQEQGIFSKRAINKEVENEIQKLSRFIPITYVNLHVHPQKISGQRKKYSVRGKIITEHGYYFANNDEWDIKLAIKGVLNKFEKEMMKDRGKMLKKRKS
ncbi:MAG: CBS domain-containing protein [Candidatus Aenigmatarchaeota archaeon]